ncbi:hypothetical protein SAMN05660649_01220 [Desulfotomaculum arcticum]|uniref:Uncharacterized protein n=1 Tax=Desulfotruncus arcticus DSM 17038 TaxID=1121424 RepID=A0A1I2QFX1_9FIRM|nr:hypothetical protein [Desulfotruncus arcticus]SFG27188.1 hypothetical protein SAMN05660649_01220 [Desulfotomaculum arcticum] [Desulfotruncus arcticus DSM 17038]
MAAQHEQNGSKKLRIGKLAIDPVFLLLFLLFAASSFLLVFFLWLMS